MRCHLFTLFLVATFLVASNGQSSLEAKPAKGRRDAQKNTRSTPKRDSSRLSGPTIKPKHPALPSRPGRTSPVRPARLPGPPAPTLIPAPLPSAPPIVLPSPGPAWIPAPLPSTPPIVIPSTPPVVTPAPLPPVIIAPPIVVRPRLPRVSISIGSLRPVRRTYVGTRVVRVAEPRVAPVRIVKIIDTTHVLVSQAG